MAIEGANKALKKLDKTLNLELKHLQKAVHINVVRDLMVKILHL